MWSGLRHTWKLSQRNVCFQIGCKLWWKEEQFQGDTEASAVWTSGRTQFLFPERGEGGRILREDQGFTFGLATFQRSLGDLGGDSRLLDIQRQSLIWNINLVFFSILTALTAMRPN